MRLITPTKCVNYSINMYPSLYASPSFEIAKLRVYDHIFNVIGNGIRDTEEFIEHMRDRHKGVQTPHAKYLNGERLHYGYTEVDVYGEGDDAYVCGKTESCLDEVFTESEKIYHPEVKKWLGFNRINKFTPYPNFDKNYSTVWQIDTSILTAEWIDEIVWFYSKCEDFFDGPDSHEYHSAVPADPKKLERKVTEQAQYLTKYLKADQPVQECWDAITKDYGTEYRGDTLDFIQRRWEKEHAHIREFITETIAMLEGLKK